MAVEISEWPMRSEPGSKEDCLDDVAEEEGISELKVAPKIMPDKMFFFLS
jgi:hypothetical protein